jgi:hypothetical protein
MAQGIYFLHVPREDFVATMTDEEIRVWEEHSARRAAGGASEGSAGVLLAQPATRLPGSWQTKAGALSDAGLRS